MEPEDVEDEQLSGLGGGWELGQGDVVDSMMSEGSPWSRKTWRTSSSAVSVADGSLAKGM